jgi:eukaryotic-like serine/threonine-protein kinase
MSGCFWVGGWLVQPDLNRISNEDRHVQLEPKVMDVLVRLAASPGTVLLREALLRSCWPDTHVTDEVLTYCIFELRKAFGDDAKNPRVIQTVPRRGYRLIAPVLSQESKNVTAAAVGNPVEVPVGLASTPSIDSTALPTTVVPPLTGRPGMRLRWGWIGTAVGAVIVAVFLFSLRPWSPALSATDLILLCDFTNTTGDNVFDGTLKHALAIHLAQTPFLNIVPEDRVRETLPYMGRSPDETVTRDIGREVCVRRGIKFLLAGSIASLGHNYVVSLEALSGQTGDVIARDQIEVQSKEEILKSLGTVATRLRRQLGESAASLQRFDVPLEQATTPSLEAFKDYSAGRKDLIAGRMSEAIPHYLHALEHDPGFASAYDDLAWCYDSRSQRQKAADCARKAYGLRERTSEYEKLSITSIYHTMATGDIDKAIETLEAMRSTYPNRAPVHNTLGGRYASLGQYEKAIQSFREAIRLNRHPNAYGNMAGVLLRLNRVKEAEETLAEARAAGVDNRQTRSLNLTLAFLRGDGATMAAEIGRAEGRSDEAFVTNFQAVVAAFEGRLGDARTFTDRAIQLARRHELNEAAADFASEAARREALLGDASRVRSYVDISLTLSRDWRTLMRSGLALALAGEPGQARKLAAEMEANFPTHTLVKGTYLPALRAAIAVGSGEPGTALNILNSPACDRPVVSPWPFYVAALAHLRLGQAQQAEKEFRCIIDQRGLEPLSPSYALAWLGLGRARMAAGDQEGARKAFDQLFTLWRNSDGDSPLVRTARLEYGTLEQGLVRS